MIAFCHIIHVFSAVVNSKNRLKVNPHIDTSVRITWYMRFGIREHWSGIGSAGRTAIRVRIMSFSNGWPFTG